jgi:hypothetical protein
MEGRNNVGKLKQIIQKYGNIIHAAFNPENHLIITYWSCSWSPNTGTVIFPIEESSPCSVVVDQGEK